ncbi:MAG TPA: LysE family transporter [Candidatus Dormibacteraeota bacterium]|nr:LysE family transporter [Candidatus Dormibacteraeota bacterium]
MARASIRLVVSFITRWDRRISRSPLPAASCWSFFRKDSCSLVNRNLAHARQDKIHHVCCSLLFSGASARENAGIVSAVGVWRETLVHITAATLGVAALLRARPLAFQAIRCVGVAYLIFSA